MLAICLIVAMALINLASTRTSGASQGIASAVKVAAFVVLAIVLFASPHAAAASLPPKPPSPVPAVAGVAGLAAMVMAVRVIYQTYAGWDAAIYFSEEVHRPERNIARATFGGIALVTALYVLVNAAVLHVLSPATIAGSVLAVGDAAKVSLGAAGDTVITAIGLFSLAAIVNLQTMAAPRITFRMAHDGLLPSVLTAVAPGGAPRIGVAVAAVASVAFAATGSYESIVTIYAPWSMAGIAIICVASIRLRVAEPDLVRPWRMPLFPWIAVGAALIQIGLIVVVVWDDPRSGLLSALAAVAPLALYAALAKPWRRAAPPS